MAENKTVLVNEVFYSVQGEGVLAGTPMAFVRFAKCNMRCDLEPGPKSPGGWACDTEFESGLRCTLAEVERRAWEAIRNPRGPSGEETLVGVLVHPENAGGRWLLLTGGEPALQVDAEFCSYFRERGFRLAIETNGSILLPHGMSDEVLEAARAGRVGLDVVLELFPFDHITVSPKVAEHAVRQLWAHELRYVRGHGQAIPQPRARALHRMVSPAFLGDQVDPRAASWCVELVKANPDWRLSLQSHKFLGVR